jgi:hypothetical protein
MIEEYKALAAELHNVHYDAPNGELLKRAQRAIDVLNAPGVNDFSNYLHRQIETKLARAESEAASVRVELRLMRERCAELMSQHEPLNGLAVDRELVRQVLHYVQCGRLK